jgi:Na+/H+ antiporter NhaD/arsenite permease-like protein
MHETTVEAAGQSQAIIAAIIFVVTYALIVSEKVHRTIAALLGGLLMIWFGVVNQEEAFESIDFNVIFLLAGMMMIAFILSETGFFQWIAIKAVILGKRDPFRIMIYLCLVTAIASATLDNVTVVVLLAPVILYVASNLHISPIPFLVATVLASNIGGAATLIGDPPNILIGSAANIDFITFFINMALPIIAAMILFIPIAYLVFRKDLKSLNEQGRPRVSDLSTEDIIKDRPLLIKSLVVIGGVLIGFVVHGFLHMEPATIALSGATILLLISHQQPHKVLEHVEWDTLFFFVGLFITVEALVATGIIAAIAGWLLGFTGGDLTFTTMLILWLSAIASGIVDNIPYTATMIPLIKELGASGMNTDPMWWALVMGADFGGNFTLVGASANVVVASIAARSGFHISFVHFFKKAFFIALTTIIVATIYLLVFYL